MTVSYPPAPTYDIIYIVDRCGYLPNEEHCALIRAKLRGITRNDAIDLASDNGIRQPYAIIHDVVASLKNGRGGVTLKVNRFGVFVCR